MPGIYQFTCLMSLRFHATVTCALWLVPCDHRNFSTLETQQYPTLASRQTRPESAHFSRSLGGGNSNISLFSSRKLGKWSKLTSIFFRWTETTTQFFFFSREIWTAILILDCRRGIAWNSFIDFLKLGEVGRYDFFKGRQLPPQMLGIVWNEQSQTFHGTGIIWSIHLP